MDFFRRIGKVLSGVAQKLLHRDNAEAKSKKKQRVRHPSATGQRAIFEYNGEKHTAHEWAKILNVSYKTIYKRVAKTGKVCAPKTEHKKVPPLTPPKQFSWNGQTKTAVEWAREYGCTANAIKKRFRKTRSPEAKPHKVPMVFPYGGESLTIKEWAAKLGSNPKTIASRIRKFKSPYLPTTKASADTPILAKEPIAEEKYGYLKQWKTINDWAAEYKISKRTVSRNFKLYGQPTKPEDEDDYAPKSNEISEEEKKVDTILKEVDARNKKAHKETFREYLARIEKTPVEDIPLREILGIKEVTHYGDGIFPEPSRLDLD